MADEKPRRKKATEPTPKAAPAAPITVGDVPTEPVVELVVLGERAAVAVAIVVDLTDIERARLLGEEERVTRSQWAALERRLHAALSEAVTASLGHRIDGCA
jgi:hypothetical protein